VEAISGTRSSLESRTVHPEEISPESSPALEEKRSADVLLVEQLRRGDADAGYRFFREQYPGIYRYLLWLTQRPDVAEDLAQETFLRAWRYLHTFDGRAPLSAWLHRIAHREFLSAFRGQKAQASLDEIPEVAEPRTAELAEAVELREIIRKLPDEQAEIVVLHYLQGYSCEEIARIVRSPVSTVKYRLLTARSQLQRELGEGDLLYLNEPGVIMRQWAWLPLDQIHALEARLTPRGAGGRAPGRTDQEALGSTATMEENMERREFLRQAALGAAGLMLPETEKEVVDGRLTQKVTLAFKGTALSNLCERLQQDTGVQLIAGSSVADEKVTLFCEKLPLREVMRQLSRPFGYAWVRSTRNGQYRYELMQDLRSQLLEEELRNRDRNTALLALEREIQRYRPYLDLSPDEALARAKTAPPEDRPLLERMATNGWGQIQIYIRLSHQQQAALLAGQELTFSQEPKPGEQPLPADLAHGVLQSQRNRRIFVRDGQFHLGNPEKNPDGMLLAAVPEARAALTLRLRQSEPGQFTLSGQPGVFISQSSPMSGTFYLFDECPPVATGVSPAALAPDNATANAKLARDPALQRRVSIAPHAKLPGPDTSLVKTDVNLTADPADAGAEVQGPGAAKKLTSADVLEALHHATGMPIIADFYTRLYPPEAVTLKEQPLFEALNRLADAMGLRWHKDAEASRNEATWLQFRSASFFIDRPKEVPNRLLARWSVSRRRHGMLPLDDLIEIAGLPDAQLDGQDMAEGAKEIWGLPEWNLARLEYLRPHLRFLAELTPEQRQMALGAAGLPFAKMSLAQQQKFLSYLLQPETPQLPAQAMLSECVLRMAYMRPGGFQWMQPGRPWYLPSPVQERTRDAALRAARRIDPQASQEQIAPTRPDVTFLYLPGDSSGLLLRTVSTKWDIWTR
jgi:RNA polymerase sigma-70 factor (ECF subfamily)